MLLIDLGFSIYSPRMNAFLQPIIDHIMFAVAWPAISLVIPTSQVNFYYLASSFVVISCLYLWKHRRYHKIKLRRMLRYLFPRKIFLHPSAILDYKYFAANRALRALVYAPLLLSSTLYDQATIQGLSLLLGPGHPPTPSSWAITALATIVFMVAFDFAYWFAHWCMHRYPILWEFHKVHHAAEVLTPITALRAHPIEELININMIALTTGATHGIIVYYFGEGAQEFSLLQLNALQMLYFLTLYHLRHTHVWLSIEGPLRYIFLSPAQHQIHHSTAKRHQGKNLGYLFAFWDYAFGTIYEPKEREHLKLGIGVQGREFTTLWRLYTVPFIKLNRRWAAWRKTAGTANRSATTVD